jgi:hypothetical protein
VATRREWTRINKDENYRRLPHTCPFFLDFDCPDGLLPALRDVLSAVQFLEGIIDIPPEWIDVVFSGKKGFHITVPAAVVGNDYDSEATDRVRQAAYFLADSLQLATADMGIYTYPRMFRAENSIHASGLWCVPVSLRELSEAWMLGKEESIRAYFAERAKAPRDWEYSAEDRAGAELVSEAAAWFSVAANSKRKRPPAISLPGRKAPDFVLPPHLAKREFPQWVEAALQTPCHQNAHYQLLAMSMDLARMGLSREVILQKLWAWDAQYCIAPNGKPGYSRAHLGIPHVEALVDGAIVRVSSWKTPGDEDAISNAKRANQQRQLTERSKNNGRASIFLGNLQQRDMLRDLWRILRKEYPPPKLAQRSNRLVRLVQRPDGHAIEPISIPVMARMTVEHGDWYAETPGGYKCSQPPRLLLDMMVATPPLDLPILERICAAPMLDREGRVLAQDGYIPEHRMFMELAPSVRNLTVPEYPTKDQVAVAKDRLEEIVADFPFASDADHTHFFATLFLPFVRTLIDGPAPATLFEAPMPASGKSLLATIVAIIATGAPPAATTWSGHEEEQRKGLFAVMRDGAPIILIDNLPQGRQVTSPTLAAILTAFPDYKDRVLGGSATESVPNYATWLLTGNNPRFSNEILRRLLRCRIDPNCPRPEERKGFRHPDLRRYVERNRAQLVQDILTIARGWYLERDIYDGGNVPANGSFEEWCKVIGGIMEFAGWRNLLGNKAEFAETSDEESEEFAAFISEWLEARFTKPHDYEWSTKELAELARKGDALGGQIDRCKTPRAEATMMGRLLHTMKGRVYNAGVGKTARVVAVKDRGANVFRFKLVVDNAPVEEASPS